MDINIDFSSYSLNELYESKNSIDRDKYPERIKEIDYLIAQRTGQSHEEMKNVKVVGEMASRTDRFIAAFIDGAIGLIALFPIFYYVGFEALKEPSLSLMVILFCYGVISTFILHGYLIYHYGQTIGKNYMAIRIENLDGTKATFNTIYFKRMLPMQLIYLVPAVGQLISGVINPMFIFGKNKRCIHDYIASTKVSNTSE